VAEIEYRRNNCACSLPWHDGVTLWLICTTTSGKVLLQGRPGVDGYALPMTQYEADASLEDAVTTLTRTTCGLFEGLAELHGFFILQGTPAVIATLLGLDDAAVLSQTDDMIQAFKLEDFREMKKIPGLTDLQRQVAHHVLSHQ